MRRQLLQFDSKTYGREGLAVCEAQPYNASCTVGMLNSSIKVGVGTRRLGSRDAARHFWHGRRPVKHSSIIVCSIGLILPALAAIENGSLARAAEVPAYFKPIVGTETSSAAEIGTKNVLQLNTTMFELYGDARSSRRTSWRSTR
jgi:hypothetical protein